MPKNWEKIVFVSLSALCLVGFVAGRSAMAAKTLASINGVSISEKDVASALHGFNEGQRRKILEDKNSKKQIVEDLIGQELLYQQAKKSNLQSSAEYKNALMAFEKELLANLMIKQKFATQMTDVAARKYYQNHKFRFSSDQIHAMHILTKTESQAMKVLAKAKMPGTDFEELADQYSVDPTAKYNRGDLGFFGRDRMVPAFTNAAFGAEKGSITGPVKTAYGYHVIKIVDKKLGKAMEYDEVELQVKGALRQDLVKKYVTQLKAEAKIKRYI